MTGDDSIGQEATDDLPAYNKDAGSNPLQDQAYGKRSEQEPPTSPAKAEQSQPNPGESNIADSSAVLGRLGQAPQAQRAETLAPMNRTSSSVGDTNPVPQAPRVPVNDAPPVAQQTLAYKPEVNQAQAQTGRPAQVNEAAAPSQLNQNQPDRSPAAFSQSKPAEIASNQPRPVEAPMNPTLREAPKVAPVLVEPSDNRTRPQPVQQQPSQQPFRTGDSNPVSKPTNNESVLKSDTATASQALKPMSTSMPQEQNTSKTIPAASDSRTIDPRSVQATSTGSRVEQSNVSGTVTPPKSDLQPDAKVSASKQDVTGMRVEPDRSSANAGTRIPPDRTATTSGGSDIRTQPDRSIAATNVDGRLQPTRQPNSDATGGSDIAQGIRVPADKGETISGADRGAAGGRVPDGRSEPGSSVTGASDRTGAGYSLIEKEIVVKNPQPDIIGENESMVILPEKPVSRTPTPASEAENVIKEQLENKDTRSNLLDAIRKFEQGKTEGHGTKLQDLVELLPLLEPRLIQQVKDLLVREPLGKGNEQAEQVLIKQLLALFPKDDDLKAPFKTPKEGVVYVEGQLDELQEKATNEQVYQSEIVRLTGKIAKAYRDTAEKIEELVTPGTPKKDGQEPEQRRRYVVKEGDTLKSIAKSKLKDALLAQLILDLNRSVITTPISKPLTAKLVILLPTTDDIAEYRKRVDDSLS